MKDEFEEIDAGSSPLKVAIRTDGEWVMIYVAAPDGSWKVEIARILKRICDERKDVWKEFKEVTRKGGFHVIESVTGGKVTSYEELPPEMLEGGGKEA